MCSHEVVGAGKWSTLSTDTHARTAPAALYLVYTNRFPDMLADNTHYPWVLTADARVRSLAHYHRRPENITVENHPAPI